MQNLIMPFGKHKGKDLLYIIEWHPKYMLWLSTIELKGKLAEAIPVLIETEYFKESLKEYLQSEQLYYEALRDCSDVDLY